MFFSSVLFYEPRESSPCENLCLRVFGLFSVGTRRYPDSNKEVRVQLEAPAPIGVMSFRPDRRGWPWDGIQ
jgi:hypothetical protein